MNFSEYLKNIENEFETNSLDFKITDEKPCLTTNTEKTLMKHVFLLWRFNPYNGMIETDAYIEVPPEISMLFALGDEKCMNKISPIFELFLLRQKFKC